MLRYLVSNDAGAANIIKHSFLEYTPEEKYVLTGPAVNIFGKPQNNITFQDFVKRLKKNDKVITGTGWQTDLEVKAIVAAKSTNSHVSSVIDHWVNYKERFLFEGEYHFPDQIFFTNDSALEQGKILFPDTVILTLVENKYESLEIKKINSLPSKKDSILYLCEEMSEHNAKLRGYNEFNALGTFIKWVRKKELTHKSLILRMHPAEKEDKYNNFQRECMDAGLNVIITNGLSHSLSSQIAKAEFIIGCSTMPMWIAYKAGKKVLSSIPFGKGLSSIPIPDLRYCHHLDHEI